MRELGVDSVPIEHDVTPLPRTQRVPEPAKRLQTAEFLAETLRAAALTADLDGAPADSARIWNSLVKGDLKVLESFYTPDRWLALLAERDSAQAVPARSCTLLEPVLLGNSQKNTAYDNGVSFSTISMHAHRALERLGVSLTPSKAPPLLALLARASRGVDVPRPRVSRFTHSSRSFLVVSVLRPELQLAAKLPDAEYRVLCGLIEGASYAEIAARRRTSTRTVANQVASLFHRLSVSGRSEMLSYLMTKHPASALSSPRGEKVTISRHPVAG